MSSQDLGLFCISVDCTDADALSTELVRRQRDLIALLERFEVPSNWTIYQNEPMQLPANAELTVGVSKGLERAALIQHIRHMQAALLRENSVLRSVVVDPHEARNQWDVLVRQGCTVARPRTAEVTRDAAARILRGGLWIAPLSCSFVGGSRRSVRSLFSRCQRRLVDSTTRKQLFHLNVDVGRTRDSWAEELEALRALLETARDQCAKGRARFATLSEVPHILTKKSAKPMLSILRAA